MDDSTIASSEKPVVVGVGEDEESEPSCLSKAEKRAVWKYRAKLFVGLLFPFFLDSMDVTIIATALPHIAADFGKLDQRAWVVTAFSLPGTALIPACGQLSDVFGRHARG